MWAGDYFSMLNPPQGRGAAYMQLLRDHGINPFAWPVGARLQWQRENGEISWPGGRWSPRSDGTVPT